ncbi:MAG: hypothetical protein JRH15_04065 [Deltaproteobacteria bacterium]|nr:hypothetical protein [Deltaproteobacteria bacterium]
MIKLLGKIAVYLFQNNQIDSFTELKKAIKEAHGAVDNAAAHSTTFWINPERPIEGYNPEGLKKMDAIKGMLQKHASNLNASIHNLDNYTFFSFWRQLPPKPDLIKAVHCLNKISYFHVVWDKEKIEQEIDDFYRLTRTDG